MTDYSDVVRELTFQGRGKIINLYEVFRVVGEGVRYQDFLYTTDIDSFFRKKFTQRQVVAEVEKNLFEMDPPFNFVDLQVSRNGMIDSGSMQVAIHVNNKGSVLWVPAGLGLEHLVRLQDEIDEMLRYRREGHVYGPDKI